MTREPPLNWVGRDVRVVGALGGVEDVVGDVEPELDERRAEDRQERGDGVEEVVARGDGDADDDRDDRRGQEGKARRAEGQPAAREAWLDGGAALGGEGVEVAAGLADRALRVLEERRLLLVPAPGSLAREREARSRPSADGRQTVPQTVTWRRSS